MAAERTAYSLKNEQDEWTTITLPKYIADILQANLPNVHQWLQTSYTKIAERFPLLTRREKGVEVVNTARNKALEYLDPDDFK